jgi:hypothetical protein
MKTIQLRGKHSEHAAIVDDSDFQLVANRKWYGKQNGRQKTLYAVSNNPCPNGVPGGQVYMHRLILRAKSGDIADHCNGNGLDNRRINLRLGTHQQNMLNMRNLRRDKTSKFKGVSLRSDCNRWIAQGFGEPIGLFESEREAALAYDREAVRRYGDQVSTNASLGRL